MALGTNDAGELVYSLAYHIASALEALLNCQEHGNTEWEARHRAKLEDIERNYLPSGAGIDSGTTIDLGAMTPAEGSAIERIVLGAGYHHMDESGYYDGWTSHVITVTPSFCGIDIGVDCDQEDDDGTCDYLHDVFHATLSQEYPMSEFHRPE